MEKLITGIHHVNLKACGEEKLLEAVSFYTDILGMKVLRDWGEGNRHCVQIDTGNGLLEINADGGDDLSTGMLNHYALSTNHVDEIVHLAKEAGYDVDLEPKDVLLAGEFPIRIAFVVGPLHERIELFEEKF